jgi:predicted nucleic acid-binding protein
MPPRIVFDANIFVMAVCKERLPFSRDRIVHVPPPNANPGVLAISIVLKGIEDGLFPCELFVSHHILVNVIHALKRRFGWPQDDVTEYVDFIRELAEDSGGDPRFNPTSQVTDCEDIEDRKILALALDAEADLLVTEDTELLHLSPWRGIPIMRAADFRMRAVTARSRANQMSRQRSWVRPGSDPGSRR